jgi:hypothetical protein
MGAQQGSVHCQVGWGPRVGLDLHTGSRGERGGVECARQRARAGAQRARSESSCGGACVCVWGGGNGGTHINTPLVWVQPVRRKRARLAHLLNLVNVLIATIVARIGQALSVLVRQHRAQALQHGAGGKVLLRHRRGKRQGGGWGREGGRGESCAFLGGRVNSWRKDGFDAAAAPRTLAISSRPLL